MCLALCISRVNAATYATLERVLSLVQT